MFENNNRMDRFAIRKLTVGVASVLIDVCFFRGNVNVVSADPIGGDAQTEQSVKTEKQTKPVVEARTDGGTEAGSDRDVGAVETEQGQQKDTDAKPVVDEEPQLSLIIQVMPKMVHLKEKVRIILGMQRKMRILHHPMTNI